MKTLALTLFLLFTLLVKSQPAAPLRTVCTLPGVINESSGVEKTGPNVFWSHNDSGGQPQIYKFDSAGTLLKTITISNASNIDWEDIAEDDYGNFYIGDFGNNSNDRSVMNGSGLKIYKISDPDLIVPNTVTASVINFEYADRNFAAPAGNHNFDMEAFFFYNDSLHLFTKNRTNPSNGWIKHYILPSVPGTYSAMRVDSFNNGGARITSADISPDKKTVALLAVSNIWLFSCYTGSKFLSTGANTILSVSPTQKEAIVFSNDSMVYITDELTNPVGQKLYHSNLASFISTLSPVIQFSNNVLQSNYALNNQWYLNGNAIPGATASAIVPANNGTYYVLVTRGSACSASSNSITITSAGISEQYLNAAIVFRYTGDEYQVSNKNNFTADVELCDVTGRNLSTLHLLPGETGRFNSERMIILVKMRNDKLNWFYASMWY